MSEGPAESQSSISTREHQGRYGMSLTLTAEELVELTDREKPTAQVRRLRALGIPFIYAPGGPVKVLRAAIDKHAEVKKAPREGYDAEPDFSMFRKRE